MCRKANVCIKANEYIKAKKSKCAYLANVYGKQISVLRKMCKLRKMCNKQNVGMKQICVEEEENCMCIKQNVSIKQMCVGKVNEQINV